MTHELVSIDLPHELLLAQETATELILQAAGLPASGGLFLPAGIIAPYGGTVVPSGWLFCDGAAISRSLYAPLFAVIGTGYGAGDGETSFNLPDLRGRSPLGIGQGDGLTERSLGETGGEEMHTLTQQELARHRHNLNQFGETATSNCTSAATRHSDVGLIRQTTFSGGDEPHNNMPPYLVTHFIIKT